MVSFKDRVIFIVGAGSPTGLSLSLAFARLGAGIAACDFNPLALDETLRQVRQAGGQAREYIFDIAKRMPVQAMVSQALEDWGKIDVLVSLPQVDLHAPLLDMDEWDWHRTLDVNLAGPFLLMQQVGRQMLQQGGGIIINLGRAEPLFRAMPGQSAFAAARLGLLALSRTAAQELAPDIPVHLILCSEQGQPDRTSLPGLGLVTPVELGAPEVLEDLVVWLCRPGAGRIPGQVIVL